jgi:hypothetical protein
MASLQQDLERLLTSHGIDAEDPLARRILNSQPPSQHAQTIAAVLASLEIDGSNAIATEWHKAVRASAPVRPPRCSRAAETD